MTLRISSFVRPAKFILAVIVGALTLAVVGHATQTIVTSNSAVYTYTLNPGQTGENISPPADTPVWITADQTGTVCGCDDVGSSFMTLVNSSVDRELVWNGFESNKGGLTAGFNPTLGTHIMYIDFSHLVDLEVNNGTSFHVTNSSSNGATANGSVTMDW
jgi:multisubunit Na+/H+ antiporter MnhB subunit